MDKVLSALGHADRLGVVLWLLKNGPARQVEILAALEDERGHSINPGAVTALLKPLLDSGVLHRDRPRAPIAVQDPQRTAAILRAAAFIADEYAEVGKRRATTDFENLRRALIREAPGTAEYEGTDGLG